jgi:growth factor-regulated tyrosine kinase substrate
LNAAERRGTHKQNTLTNKIRSKRQKFIEPRRTRKLLRYSIIWPAHQSIAVTFNSTSRIMNGAPDWQDGECCFRCRTQFTLVARKHHCRNCGNIFCAKCSSQQIPLPKLNIEKNVRVCDTCYEKITGKNADPLSLALGSSDKEQSKTKSSNSKSSSNNKQSANTASAPSEQELKEEEDLQLALALSLTEPNATGTIATETIATEAIATARFPDCRDFETHQVSQPAHYQVVALDGDQEVFRFVGEVQSTLEIFNNRLESCKLRNRPIANDAAIQSSFLKLSAEFQPKLAEYIKTYEDERANYERLQDKLSQIADARAALDALREEHQEKVRQQAAEAERQRQTQLATKLEAMRQKKSQMMQYQRELALQRIREQEMMLHQQPAGTTGYQAPPATVQPHSMNQQYTPTTQVSYLPNQQTQQLNLYQLPQVTAPPSTQMAQTQVPYVPPPPPQPTIDRASIAQLERQFLPDSKPEEDAPLISFDD